MNNDATAGAVVALSDTAWQEQVFAAMRSESQRFTIPRRQIIGWIAERTAPFSAEALVEAMAARNEGIGRSTVYRTVDWLRAEGWLGRVGGEAGEHTYARTLPGHHHHAVCTQCGHTLVVSGCAAVEALSKALAQQGFTVSGHTLEIFGTCQQCQL
jgi:Fur family transcriptional regulator, ferric uptake regulator